MNINQEDHFDQYAYDWWNKAGYYKLLHRLNPIRLKYIQSKYNLSGKRVLDIGCGGGLLSEELCKNGAIVTGIDSSSKSIKIAKQHAKEQGLDITYINESIFKSSFLKEFDCIICFEMIEHVDDQNQLVADIGTLLNKKSKVFFSTINNEFLSNKLLNTKYEKDIPYNDINSFIKDFKEYIK